MTVNHDVAGSSPAGGATRRLESIMFSSLFLRFQDFFRKSVPGYAHRLPPTDCYSNMYTVIARVNHFKFLNLSL